MAFTTGYLLLARSVANVTRWNEYTEDEVDIAVNGYQNVEQASHWGLIDERRGGWDSDSQERSNNDHA